MQKETSFWLPAGHMKLPSSAPAAAAEYGHFHGLAFADSTADDHAFGHWYIPRDADLSKQVAIYLHYHLPSGTISEGEWNCTAGKFKSGTAVAVGATALTDVKSTPLASAKVTLAGPFVVPASLLEEDNILTFDIGHDVTDAFGGTVGLLGVEIRYTRN